MGVIRRIKSTIKKVSAFIVALPLIIKVVALLTIIVTAATFLSDLFEMLSAKNTPTEIYENLEIEDVSELIQIKGNSETGYYLDFIDDIDTKLTELVKDLDNVPTDISFLKKLIQAEVVTKFPDLGGEIPEGESGFQGAIDIKRVTPNKEVGEMKNTGQGETSILEPESSYTDVSLTPKEEEIKNWEEGKNLVLYNDSYVYDEEDNVWIKREKDSKYVIISRNDEVRYTGNYKKVEDKLNDTVTFYIEVKSGNITGYIQSKNINIRSSNREEEENEQSQKTEKNENIEVSSRATTSREREIVGEEGNEYTVAIAAGHNNTDDTGAESGGLIEEDLTIQVAEKVEELINEKYENVTIIQTGSTSENPGGIKVEDRTRLAREANPDLCIQIHFNAADNVEANGVEVIYKEGDGFSQQLAEILTDSISSAMGLENREAGPDTEKCAVGSLGIIENYAVSGFPSVVTEGGFLTGNKDADVIRNGGVEKYAEGIVEGIKTYLEADHSGITATETGRSEITSSIESRIVRMKYLKPEELENMKANGNVKEATKYFTLNEDNKLVTLTWSQSDDGTVEIKENAAMDFRTALQKYHMPFEYLLYYYIDTDYRDFSEKLADIVLDSEIVITLQDNITTTETLQDTEIKVETSSNEGNARGVAHDWEVDSSQHIRTVAEVCSTKTDITYVETWCVKTYKDNSFSEKVLNMGDQDEIIVNAPGEVTYIPGTVTRGDETIVIDEQRDTGLDDEDGNDIMYRYIEKHRIATTINSLRNTYDTSGDVKTEPNTNKYVNLYIEESMNQRMQEGWFFKIVKNNEKTANLLDLTKYLMFLASNTNYGVTTFDFDIFTPKTLTSVGGGDYIVDTTQSPSEIVITDLDTLKQAFSWYSNDRVLQQYAYYFLECQERYHVNAVFAAAVSITESSAGTNIAIGGNNMFSISNGGQGNWNSYGTMESSIEAFFRLISTEYFTNGQNSVDSIARGNPEGTHMYCVPPDNWIKNTSNYMTEMFNAVGIDVSSIIGGGDFLEVAKQCHDYLRENNYYYVQGSHIPKPYPGEGTYIDCSAYVSWVLYEYGYTELEGWQQSTRTIIPLANRYGWTIKSGSEAQPGDILLNPTTHTEIYIGDGKSYNAGSTDAIRSEYSNCNPSSFQYAITVTAP